jgi:hypothetical protein
LFESISTPFSSCWTVAFILFKNNHFTLQCYTFPRMFTAIVYLIVIVEYSEKCCSVICLSGKCHPLIYVQPFDYHIFGLYIIYECVCVQYCKLYAKICKYQIILIKESLPSNISGNYLWLLNLLTGRWQMTAYLLNLSSAVIRLVLLQKLVRNSFQK